MLSLRSQRSGWTATRGCALVAMTLLAVRMASVAQIPSPTGLSSPTITNCLQLREAGRQSSGRSHPIRVEGQVCWVDTAKKAVAISDSSGGVLLSAHGLDPNIRVGQNLELIGAATIIRSGHLHRLEIDGLVLDNDDVHPAREVSGAVDLPAGRIPIQLEWFNGIGLGELALSVTGPEQSRRELEPADLFLSSEGDARALRYEAYEGWWTRLPDLDSLEPVRTGTVAGLDLTARTRDEGAGLRFSGYLEIPRAGRYTFHLNSDDGSRLLLGAPNLHVRITGESSLPSPKTLALGQLLTAADDGSWSRIEGKVTRVTPDGTGVRLELRVGQARMDIRITAADFKVAVDLEGALVGATGFCLAARNADGLSVPDLLLVPDTRWIEILEPSAAARPESDGSDDVRILRNAAEIHQLKREEAALGKPARISGVVTATVSVYKGFTLQDATGGVYVERAGRVHVGDFVEVEGRSDPGFFAPMLIASRTRHLGAGRLPEPKQPTWDQLANGSLDAQFVEIEGIVTGFTDDRMQLLTQGGVLKVRLQHGVTPHDWRQFHNSLIRIRGVLLATWNRQTHQTRLGEIRILAPSVTVRDSPPADFFLAPEKRPEDLLLFDPEASLFHRIRMTGQVVHVTESVCFMMAASSGVRFMPHTPQSLQPGDLVEVTGYPQLGGASPLLRSAAVRKTGRAALPIPRTLPAGGLANGDYDATRVRAEGILVGVRDTGTETVLEMQDGAHAFAARLARQNDLARTLTMGSQLELTGVYTAQTDNPFLDPPGSVVLLLDSAAGVRVLARPPWWTLRRLLVAVGALTGILVLAGLWITQLHRTVDARTVQLEREIQERQSIEQHRATEQERARVAQDLHDELGSGLTEIGMLASLPAHSADSRGPLHDIAHRSRQMVTALDEIVWCMNPKHDSLESLGSYLCLYADRFLKLANITCHLRHNLDLPGQTLNPIHRHELFLAFKEALNNVVRHSGATEVRLSIRLIGERLRLSIADNGHGLSAGQTEDGRNGLENMRARLDKIGGRFAITSRYGRGTTLRFYLPLG